MFDCQRCCSAETYIHSGSEIEKEVLCIGYYNTMMAGVLGVKVERYPDGVSIRGGDGVVRHFSMKKRLHSGGISMVAEELKFCGYQFAVHGELECDQGQLFLQLIDKAERAMMETFIQEGQFPNRQRYYVLKKDRLVGIVESNREEDGTPVLLVDGKPYTWEEIGKILMSYEGIIMKVLEWIGIRLTNYYYKFFVEEAEIAYLPMKSMVLSYLS